LIAGETRFALLANDAMGQTLPWRPVLATSAFPPIATKQRTFQIGSFVPEADIAHRGLDIYTRPLDHVGPLVCVGRDALSELGRGSRYHGLTQVDQPGL
jgi:hypothetical protein